VQTLLGPSLPPAPHPFPLSPTPLTSSQNLFCPLLQFCQREDIRDNKKDITCFLAWDKGSYTEFPNIASMHMCITTWIGSCIPQLFITSRSPSHSGFCQFKIAIFAPLQWAHQTLSSFGFPTFLYSSCTHSPLSVWSKSNNITAFVLGLKSTYEAEQVIFDLLSLANFA
jgi:hypothetical protein